MNVNHKIILDFTKLLKSYTINVSRGDTDSRTITILLFDNGEPMDLSDVTSAQVNVSVNGNATMNTAATVDAENHLVYFTLPADYTVTAGKTSYTLTLFTESGQLTSPEWYVNVVSQLRDDTDAITAEDLQGFMDTLARIEEMLESAQTVTERIPNPYPLTMIVGNSVYSYDGSAAVSITLSDGNSLSY